MHLRTCKLQTAECHIGGTPCPDWSSQGSRNKEAGPDAMATMAWIGQRYTLEEPIWINENVAAFDWFLMRNIFPLTWGKTHWYGHIVARGRSCLPLSGTCTCYSPFGFGAGSCQQNSCGHKHSISVLKAINITSGLPSTCPGPLRGSGHVWLAKLATA